MYLDLGTILQRDILLQRKGNLLTHYEQTTEIPEVETFQSRLKKNKEIIRLRTELEKDLASMDKKLPSIMLPPADQSVPPKS